MPPRSPATARAKGARSTPGASSAACRAVVAAAAAAALPRVPRTEVAGMSATANLQRPASVAGEEKSAISAMAFVSDSTAMARISADLFGITHGNANIREGTIDAPLPIGHGTSDL